MAPVEYACNHSFLLILPLLLLVPLLLLLPPYDITADFVALRRNTAIHLNSFASLIR